MDTRSDGRERVTVFARVDARIHARAKAAALLREVSLAAFTEEALRRQLGERPVGRALARGLGGTRTRIASEPPRSVEP